MKVYKIHCLFIFFLFHIGYTQVGINTVTPSATLDVVAEETASNNDNVLKIRNSNSENLLEVNHIGNINLGKALKPNGDAGAPGDILVSKGPNQPPIWQKNILENASIQIFSAQRNTNSTQTVPVNGGRRLDFPTVNSLPTTNIATWNPSTSLFTVNKKGIYHIVAGTNAMNLSNAASNFALFIETSNGFQTASGITYFSGVGTNFAFSTSVTFTVILNPGQTIYFTGTSGNSSWQQGSSFVSILFTELP